nr:MAG TPA: hypothetical protein [Caudoviricetes sp.]
MRESPVLYELICSQSWESHKVPSRFNDQMNE